MIKQLNKANKRYFAARLDLWESKHCGGAKASVRARQTAKRDARRAARRRPIEVE